MNQVLQLILIAVTFVFCICILSVTRKKKLSYKFTLIWLAFGGITLLIAIFPILAKELSKILFIAETVNTIYLIYIFLLILIVFYISLIFSKLFEKVTTLIQENAILNDRIEKLEQKENKNENN